VARVWSGPIRRYDAQADLAIRLGELVADLVEPAKAM
jgi:hypothetical protein